MRLNQSSANLWNVGSVVLDMRQPQAGGLTIPRELKARRIGLPVIVLGDAKGDVTFGVQVMGLLSRSPTVWRLARLLSHAI